MAARPYQNLRVDELDRLFVETPENEARLHAILDELGYRSTARALDLKRRLEVHLKVGALTPGSRATGVPGHGPKPTQAAYVQNEKVDGADARAKEVQPSGPKEAGPESEGIREKSKPDPEAMNRPSAACGPSDSAKPELSPGQRGLTQLIEYVRVLIELGEKPVWSLASYNNVVLHEDDLRNRIGIRHDLTDIDGPIYLKIDRLRRTDPPEPPTAAKDWLTVSRDPFKEPVIQSLRMTVMAADEAERLIAQGAVDRADVTKALKPKPGADLRDVVLRLNRFPEAKANVEDYIAQAYPMGSVGTAAARND